MKASSRTISLVILLCLIIGFFVGIAYRAHRTATRAHGVLDAIRGLDPNGNGTQQMQSIQQRFGLQRRCEQQSCVYYVLFQNPITLQRLRAPVVEMSFSVRVDQDRLALANITLSDTDRHRNTSATVAVREDFGAVAAEQKVRVRQLAGENGRGVQVAVTLAPDSDTSVRDAAFDLNTDCLARWRGCTPKELAPKAFSLKRTE